MFAEKYDTWLPSIILFHLDLARTDGQMTDV